MTQDDSQKRGLVIILAHYSPCSFLFNLVTQAALWIFSGSPVTWKTRLFASVGVLLSSNSQDWACRQGRHCPGHLGHGLSLVSTDVVLSHTRADGTVRTRRVTLPCPAPQTLELALKYCASDTNQHLTSINSFKQTSSLRSEYCYPHFTVEEVNVGTGREVQ